VAASVICVCILSGKVLWHDIRGSYFYEGCPESIRPFWTPREPVTWPWCNLAASQTRPYCESVNSNSPVGPVSRQWDAVDWCCVLWPSHSQWPSEQISFITTMRLPILQLSWRLFFAKRHITQVCQQSYIPDLAPCDFWLFVKRKSPLKGRRFVNVPVRQHISSVNGVSLPTD
jgi:hypothetical protein